MVDRRASDDERTVAAIAAELDKVLAFFADLDDPDWDAIEVSGETIVLASSARSARVELEPTAETAGTGITKIVVTYDADESAGE